MRVHPTPPSLATLLSLLPLLGCTGSGGSSTRAAGPPSSASPAALDGGAPNVLEAASPDVADAAADSVDVEGSVPYPVPDWPTGTPEEQGLDSAGLDNAAAVAAADGSYCLLVIRHGVLVAEHYWNGSDASTANPSWSIAKSYSSTLVGIAIDRGEIASLDESVADFVPEWNGTPSAAITLRNLVSMTSGLRWSVFQDYVEMATLTQDETQFAIQQPLASAPGSTWTYDNAGVQVLERVFRNATGHTIEAYAEEHLWSKLGMKATWAHDPAGNPTTYANVLASCRDHARLGYLYLHAGRWEAGQVVSPGYVAAAVTPSQAMNRAYGLLWWLNAGTPSEDAMMQPWPGRAVPFAPVDLFAARGFGNQFVDVIPSLDLLVVRFGKDPLGGGFDPLALATDARFATHDEILAPVLNAILY